MAKTPSVPQQLSASWCFTFTAESCSQITWAQPQQRCIHQDTCTDPDFSALSKLLRVGALSTALDLLPCKGMEGHAAGQGTRRSASDIVGGLGCAAVPQDLGCRADIWEAFEQRGEAAGGAPGGVAGTASGEHGRSWRGCGDI